MLNKVANGVICLVLGVIVLFGFILGFNTIIDNKNKQIYVEYDATDLLSELKDVYDEDFMVCDSSLKNASILENESYTKYKICGVNDKSCRFGIQDTVNLKNGKGEDKLELKELYLFSYGVSKACNLISNEIKSKTGVIDILLDDTTALHFEEGKEEEIKDLLKNEVYLSDPVKFVNSFINGEYYATYFYPIDYDRQTALKEVVNNFHLLGLNEYDINIVFVTDEEYNYFKNKFDNYENMFAMIEQDEVGITIQNRGDAYTYSHSKRMKEYIEKEENRSFDYDITINNSETEEYYVAEDLLEKV